MPKNSSPKKNKKLKNKANYSIPNFGVSIQIHQAHKVKNKDEAAQQNYNCKSNCDKIIKTLI